MDIVGLFKINSEYHTSLLPRGVVKVFTGKSDVRSAVDSLMSL